MEALNREGLAKAIGVANFYLDRLIDLIVNNEITPAVNQIETHPFFQRTPTRWPPSPPSAPGPRSSSTTATPQWSIGSPSDAWTPEPNQTVHQSTGATQEQSCR
jgi:hypothetical protein